MKKTTVYFLLCIFTFTLACCNKKDNSNNTGGITIESLSGTYALKALVWRSSSDTVNVYDQLDPCERDNLTKLNTDKTLNFIEAGTICSPPENYNGTWDLKGDSIYVNPGETSKIVSFDGKTIVLTGIPNSDPDVRATTTLEKQ